MYWQQVTRAPELTGNLSALFLGLNLTRLHSSPSLFKERDFLPTIFYLACPLGSQAARLVTRIPWVWGGGGVTGRSSHSPQNKLVGFSRQPASFHTQASVALPGSPPCTDPAPDDHWTCNPPVPGCSRYAGGHLNGISRMILSFRILLPQGEIRI